MITVQEQRMLEFMNTATNKENWYRKVWLLILVRNFCFIV